MFLVILLYAILASTFTIAKIALSFAKPFFIIGFRMTVAGILMLSFLYFFRREKFVLKKEDRWLNGEKGKKDKLRKERGYV